ncbi:hypothetical protein KIN20_033619 [Parelaphostrongylus tenuis]|uniref:Uncharacterized protein n=1 Tax=Parelaphostrongylus tenuis TaxID=148309 RepID=A0AAD5R8Q9_PARTN|nr:hypothetical protein KIN20_033619 [Parelaphostrongylus tenuis]
MLAQFLSPFTSSSECSVGSSLICLSWLSDISLSMLSTKQDDVITDEEVADDDDHTPRPNTAHYDGKKTTITISTEAGIELYQHWMDQAVSALMAAVATDKMSKVSESQRAAHQTCAKSAKTVQQHAKCVVVLLDLEEKYKNWNAKFGNAQRIGKSLSL